jgi:DNA ligase-1
MAFAHWWVFGNDHMNWRYKKRMKWLHKQFDHYNEGWEGPINGEGGRMIQVVKTCNLVTPAMIKVMHQFFLDQGYEGSVIRLNERYERKRSKNLLKIKDFQDAEATIIDWVEGKGKRKGTIGKFMAEDPEGIQFGMPVMDKFKKLQRNFKKMQKWVGKVATFTYFERTKANSYRHPLFKALRNYE